MMLRRLVSRLVFLAALMVLTGGVTLSSPGQNIFATGVDWLFWARHHIAGPIARPSESKVALVVVDEETYRHAPFKQTPRVAWTPYFAEILNAVGGAGADVIGFDYVFPTSLDRSDLLRGYDKPLLKALRKLARQDRIVLGDLRLSEQALRPYPAQIKMVGEKNVRPLNILLDSDGVVRRARAALPTLDGGKRDVFATTLMKKSGIAVPADSWWINYNTGMSDLPVYGLSDLYACLKQGRQDFFDKAFQGRIVLFGTWLDIEDRRLTSKRLAKPLDSWRAPPNCGDDPRSLPVVARQTMPGIGIHAATINTVAQKRMLTAMTPSAQALAVAAVTLFAGVMFLVFPLLPGVLAGIVLLSSAALLSYGLFLEQHILPVFMMMLSVPIAWGGSFSFRFLVEDRARRRIQAAFGQYLAPSLVEQMRRSGTAPSLGGETRQITIWFSDIAGYTNFSEALAEAPDRLLSILNEYFTLLGGIIEKHGGYIDKFIGDAAMVIWGAPLDQPNQQKQAVLAAMEALDALDDFNRDVIVGKYGLPPIDTRIGLNTGKALVGNMGSDKRLNYTVIGDAVNLAARLEGANKNFGTRLMIGEATARPLHREFVLRRLDKLVVKGKSRPVRVYQVIGLRKDVPEDIRDRVRIFHQAMAYYYRRDFILARQRFDFIRKDDPVAALFLDRCRHFEQHPPPDDWDGRFVMTTK